MKTRRNKIIGILLTLAILLQGIAWPVSALEAEETVSSTPAVSDTQLTEASELDKSEAVNEPSDPTENEDQDSTEPSETADTANESDETSQVGSDETKASEPTPTEPTEPEAEEIDETTPETEVTAAATPTPAVTAEPDKSEEAKKDDSSQAADPTNETEGPASDDDTPLLPPDTPLIGPMFVGALSLLKTAMTPMALGDSGLELSKTATYNPETGKVDFEFNIFSTGEISTVVSTKPVDIVLVLDQSGSMTSNFGSGYAVFTGSHSTLYSNTSSLYVLYNGQFLPVTVTRTGFIDFRYTYTYNIPGGGQVRYPETGTVGLFDPLPSWPFYRYSSINRITALKTAAAAFVDTIMSKAIAGDSDGNPIPHRISIVGFSQPSNGNYAGTEILTVISGTPVRYNNLTDTIRANSLMDVTTVNGRNALQTAIGRINTYNYTSTHLGMEMARDVLTATAATATGRDRIVVMLTDGVPTVPGNSYFNNGVANDAIDFAKDIKDAGHQVFTIGIFPGADNSSIPGTPSNDMQRANRFMHLVSSNYPNASSMTTPGAGGAISRGFYFSNADPEALYQTFQTISETVGQTNTDLTAETSMIDYLIPQLSAPINASNVVIRTAAVTGFTAGDEPIWGPESTNVYGAVASVDQSTKSVKVTGFPYRDHFVAKGEGGVVQGRKLIVRFSADVDPDFIGGNVIYPNLPTSGVYLPPKNGQAPELAEAFEQPDVDIPLRFDFLTQPKSIYLKNSIEPWKLLQMDGTQYIINGNTYTLNGENNEYVNITYTVKNLAGTETYGTYTILAGQTVGTWSGTSVSPEVKTEYQIIATVTPKSSGTYAPIAPTKKDFIYVYTPRVSPTDKSIYLTQVTDLAERFGAVSWISVDAGAPPVEGTAPTVLITPVFKEGSNPATHGTASSFKPYADSYFDLKLEINGADVTARSSIIATAKAAEKGHQFGIFVFKPAIAATDETIWLGETTNLANRMTTSAWWTTLAGIPVPSGSAPTLTLNPIFLSGDDPAAFGGAANFAATQETRFNIQTFIGAENVTAYTQVTASTHGAANGHHFTIFVRSGTLTIKKEAAPGTTIDPNQTFLFDVVGPNGKTWTVAIQGTGQKTITGLPVGNYTVTENEDWSWRYKADLPIQNVTISRSDNEHNRTVRFKNELDDDQWLGGETVAINVYTPTALRVGGIVVGILQWIGGLKR